MKIIPIPVKYEWIEKLFGTYIADHFNEISLSLFLFGFVLWAIFVRGSEKKKNVQEEPIQLQKEIPYRIDEEGHVVPDLSKKPRKISYPQEPSSAESYFGQYDRYSDLTDEEMKLAMQMRIERTNPTYEEWKDQKLREQQETPAE